MLLMCAHHSFEVILRQMISIAVQMDGSGEKNVQSQHRLVFLIKFEYVFL